jgi:hypothetical protein
LDLIDSSESDGQVSDDFQQHQQKRRKSAVDLSTIESKLTKMQNVLNENKFLKVLTFSKDNKVPLALNNIVKESFSCKICHKAPMSIRVHHTSLLFTISATFFASEVHPK